MASSENLPSWWFRIESMQPHPEHVRQVPGGTWLPPKNSARNIGDPDRYMPVGHAFKFHGQVGNGAEPHCSLEAEPLPQCLVYNQPFQTYSVYVGTTDELYTFPYNATQRSIGDGADFPEDVSVMPETSRLPEWSTLWFGMGAAPDLSFASSSGSFRTTLAHQRESQWPLQLLPARYRGRRITEQGGLVGHTALLIALLSLTLPEEHVRRVLPCLIKKTWRCVPRHNWAAENNRRAKRGVVVKVWIDYPCGPSDPRFDRVKAIMNPWMNEYERGVYGAHFGSD